MGQSSIEATAATCVDVFSRDQAPVRTLEPGERITVRSLDASGFLRAQQRPGDRPPTLIPRARGHCLTGPLAVRGARPGEMLAIRLHAFRPDSWGWTVAAGRDSVLNRRLGLHEEPAAELLWQIDADLGIAVESRGLRRAVAPFLGVIGVAPAEPGEHSTIPPRPGSGGNIDCRELVAGSTLYLPVAVPDALVYLGDGHAAQGDGEVGGTAIECGMTSDLTVDLATEPALGSIHAETPAGRVTFGFGADLNAATGDALEAMVTWMRVIFGLDAATALALASTAVDLRITQVANQTWGVHALLPDGVLT